MLSISAFLSHSLSKKIASRMKVPIMKMQLKIQDSKLLVDHHLVYSSILFHILLMLINFCYMIKKKKMVFLMPFHIFFIQKKEEEVVIDPFDIFPEEIWIKIG